MDETTKRGLVGALGLTAAIACGGDDMAGELLRDAGELLVDAGQAIADAGSSSSGDAQAQATQPKSETFEVACTDALVRTVVSGGTTTRTITRVADLATSTGDITGIDVIVCGKEGAYSTAESCPTGAICTGTWRLVEGDCHPSVAYIETGKLRAVCGTYGAVNGAGDQSTPRWKRARITIRR